MSKARELANLGNAYSDGALSNRNLIINGAMQVAQRGTSHIIAYYDERYTIDRMKVYNSYNSGSIDQSTDAPDGFSYSMHFNTIDYTGITMLYVTVELVDGMYGVFSIGQVLTFSFYVKSPTAGTFFTTGFQAGFSAQTGYNDAIIQASNSVTIEPSEVNTWVRKQVTLTVTEHSYAPATMMQILFAPIHGSKITGLQLELGDTATPFEHRSYGQELALCQRYYEVGTSEISGAAGPNGAFNFNHIFAVQKRATPTCLAANSWNIGGATTVSNISIWKGGSQSDTVFWYADAEL